MGIRVLVVVHRLLVREHGVPGGSPHPPVEDGVIGKPAMSLS